MYKPDKIKSSTRKNNAIERHCKHEMNETAAGKIGYAVLQQTFLFK